MKRIWKKLNCEGKTMVVCLLWTAMMFLLLWGSDCLAQKAAVKKPTAVCKPSADEQCPSTADYASLKAYIDKYQTPKAPQEETDRVNGIVLRLQNTAPAGFHFDASKLMYVKNSDKPVPPTTPPPTTGK